MKDTLTHNADLISRSAAIEAVERREKILGGYTLVSTSSFKNFLRNRPAVDAEPVRHGRWEPVIRYDVFGKPFTAEHTCSICKEEALCCCANYDPEEELSNYCPNCGAKMMDGDENGKEKAD